MRYVPRSRTFLHLCVHLQAQEGFVCVCVWEG